MVNPSDRGRNSTRVPDMRSRPLWERLPPRHLTAREIAACLPTEAAPDGGKVCAYGWVVEGEELEDSPFVAFVVRSRSFHHFHCTERDGWQRVGTARGEGLGYGTSREVLDLAADLLDADTEMITEIATADPHGNDAAFDEARRAARRREDSGPHTEFDELPEDEAKDLRASIYAERIESETVDEDALKKPVEGPIEDEVRQAKADRGHLGPPHEWVPHETMAPDYTIVLEADDLEPSKFDGGEVRFDLDGNTASIELYYENRTGHTGATTGPVEFDEGEPHDLHVRRDGDDLVAEVRLRDGTQVAEVRRGDVFDSGGASQPDAAEQAERLLENLQAATPNTGGTHFLENGSTIGHGAPDLSNDYGAPNVTLTNNALQELTEHMAEMGVLSANGRSIDD